MKFKNKTTPKNHQSKGWTARQNQVQNDVKIRENNQDAEKESGLASVEQLLKHSIHRDRQESYDKTTVLWKYTTLLNSRFHFLLALKSNFPPFIRILYAFE